MLRTLLVASVLALTDVSWAEEPSVLPGPMERQDSARLRCDKEGFALIALLDEDGNAAARQCFRTWRIRQCDLWGRLEFLDAIYERPDGISAEEYDRATRLIRWKQERADAEYRICSDHALGK